MTDYYGFHHYQSYPYVSNYYGDSMDYNGYSDVRKLSYGGRNTSQHQSSGYDRDMYHHDHSVSGSRARSQHYTQNGRYNYSRQARLAWQTEIPVKLRVSLCCEGCSWKLDEDLRDLEGVYDVGLSGWSNALLTVTGTASVQRVLERARRSANHAEIWSDRDYYKGW